MRELSIVIPTYNERDNVEPLLEKLDAALAGIDWEAIFVDDNSVDKTYQKVAAVAVDNARVKILRRVGRRGLSTACIEGALIANASIIAVMDADLQHDEKILPAMFAKINNENCEIVVGSRYTESGSTGEWNATRTLMSKFATKCGAILLKENFVSDPMSGFFMLRRELFEEVVENLSGEGFKILLDILTATRRELKIDEVAYTFHLRVRGESKLSLGVLSDFALLLVDKTMGRYIPPRFLLFVAVGLTGVVVHLGALSLLHSTLTFIGAQLAATLLAMITNFFCNNYFTFSGRSLQRGKLWRGFAYFLVICSIGALPNILLSDYLFSISRVWWLLAGGIGMLVSAAWNFSVSHHFIWRRR